MAAIASRTVSRGGFTDPRRSNYWSPVFPGKLSRRQSPVQHGSLCREPGYSDYNALEVQFTMRPTHGLSLMATYGFSKRWLSRAMDSRIPLNPKLDYGMSVNSVGSDIRTNGTFELPMGPNKLLFANSAGWMARAMERWQMGFIYNWASGSPRTFISGNNMLYANGRPNIVGPWTNPEGRWSGKDRTEVSSRMPTRPTQIPNAMQCNPATPADSI